LVFGNLIAPTKQSKRGARGQARQNKSSSAVDSLIMSSAKATGSTTNIVSSDLRLKRQNFNIVQAPPRSLGDQTFWARLSLADLPFNVSSTGITENNLAFNASSFNGFSNAASFFDQYCIYAVTVTYSSTLSGSGPIHIYTAIDYDSIANVGIAGIEAFTSFNETILGGNGQDSLVRFLKPCIAPQVTSSSNLPVAGGVGRSWLDAAYPSVNHYGIRMILNQYPSSVTGAVNGTVSAVFGFRNNQ
jgi:hypothetical protein